MGQPVFTVFTITVNYATRDICKCSTESGTTIDIIK